MPDARGHVAEFAELFKNDGDGTILAFQSTGPSLLDQAVLLDQIWLARTFAISPRPPAIAGDGRISARQTSERQMPGQVSRRHGRTRLSARSSIALWLVLAALVWGTVGLAITFATQGADAVQRAQADQLSKIVPTAGGVTAQPDSAGRER
jgi:hypothetical protein